MPLGHTHRFTTCCIVGALIQSLGASPNRDEQLVLAEQLVVHVGAQLLLQQLRQLLTHRLQCADERIL